MSQFPMSQVPTRPVGIFRIMRSAAFARGVADARAGHPPRYDAESRDDPASINAAWDYERGRQWAVVAPRNMSVMIGSKVNDAATKRKYWRDIL